MAFVPPAAWLPANAGSIAPDDCRAKFAKVIIDVFPKVALAPLVPVLWSEQYHNTGASPWVSGRDAGENVVFGLDSFSETLATGTARYRPHPTFPASKINEAEVHLAAGTGCIKFSPRSPSSPGLWEGGKVMLTCVSSNANAVHWVQSVTAKRVTLANAFTHWTPGGAPVVDNAKVQLRCRSRAFFDRQFGPKSAANNASAQEKLLQGDPMKWDFTLLMWVLLNSGHHDQAVAGTASSDIPKGGQPWGLAFRSRWAHQSAAVRHGLKELRQLRNRAYGHVASWPMTPQDLCRTLVEMSNVCAEIDSLVTAIISSGRCPAETTPFNCEAEFQAAVLSLLNERLTEIQRLQWVTALRQRLQVLPFERNPQFIGRGHQMDEIRTVLATGGRGVVSHPASLSGLGGIGKTALAVAFAYHALDAGEYPGGCLTLNCASPEDLKRSVIDIALDHIALDASQRQQWQNQLFSPGADTLKSAWFFVHRWLQTCTARWLLLLDNADDAAWFTGTNVWTDICALTQGHVIITSRVRTWTAPGVQTITLVVPSADVAEQMIMMYKNQLTTAAQAADAIAALDTAESTALLSVVKDLDCLPLGLEQVGMYLRKNDDCTIAEYRRLFGEAERDLLKMFGKKQYESLSIRQNKSVATTWAVNVNSVSLRARTLLCAFSLLAPDNIPTDHELLGPILQQVEGGNAAISLPDLRDCIVELKELSLVSSSGAPTVRVHRLLQLFSRCEMDEPTLQSVTNATCSILRAHVAFWERDPNMTARERAKYLAVYPHVLQIVNREPAHGTARSVAMLATAATRIAHERGSPSCARLADRALTLYDEAHEHTDSFDTASALLCAATQALEDTETASQLVAKAKSMIKRLLQNETPGSGEHKELVLLDKACDIFGGGNEIASRTAASHERTLREAAATELVQRSIAHRSLGLYHLEDTGDLSEALGHTTKALQHMLELYGKDSAHIDIQQVFVQLSFVHRQSGHIQKCCDCLEKAVHLAGQNPYSEDWVLDVQRRYENVKWWRGLTQHWVRVVVVRHCCSLPSFALSCGLLLSVMLLAHYRCSFAPVS